MEGEVIHGGKLPTIRNPEIDPRSLADVAPKELSEDVRFTSWARLYMQMTGLMGEGERDWSDMQPQEQDALEDAFRICQNLVAAASNTPYDTIAKGTFVAFHRLFTSGESTWEQTTETDRHRWRCLSRHMLNLLLIEGESDGPPREHESEMLARFTDLTRTQ